MSVSLYGRNAFQQIKADAAAKRDAAIKKAKAEYRATIKQIGELQARLTGPRERGRKNARIRLIDIVFDNLPTDRAFSYADVAGIIESVPTARDYAQSSINMTISRLLKAGDIKRVQYAKHNKPALFALPSVQIETEKTMLEWAKEVEGWQDL